MMESPSFGTLLSQLATRRKLGVQELSRRAEILEPDLQAVINGARPDHALLRQLAPALEIHAADLFAMAHEKPPIELTPLDPRAGLGVPQLVGLALRLPPESLSRLRQYVQSLPQHERTHPATEPGEYEHDALGPGAVILQMLSNRNLTWTSSAKLLSRLAHQHLAASSVGALGHGRRDLTAELLMAFASVLGIHIDDLAAVAAIDMPDPVPATGLTEMSIAELIWDLRRLTVEQVSAVQEVAKILAGKT